MLLIGIVQVLRTLTEFVTIANATERNQSSLWPRALHCARCKRVAVPCMRNELFSTGFCFVQSTNEELRRRVQNLVKAKRLT